MGNVNSFFINVNIMSIFINLTLKLYSFLFQNENNINIDTVKWS